jgi:iron complex transport system ATP-binding protein
VTVLRTHGLAVGYPGRTLCTGLDLAFEPGQCWAVLGNNGSGKSTLLHVLAGVQAPLSGRVECDGNALAGLPPAARARALGLLLQEEPGMFWGSVREYVLLGRYPHRSLRPGWGEGDERVADAALAEMHLEDLAGRPLAQCSGGERQRARLAQLLAQDPRVLLLDEPLLHLDLRHQLEVLAALQSLARRGSRAVVMVLHDPARARRFCDHALLLFEGGATVQGPADALLRRSTLERLYRCEVEGIEA